MNTGVSSGRTGMLLAACAALIVLGCGAEPHGSSDGKGDVVADSSNDLYFDTEADAFEWMARRAEERHLGTVAVQRDEAGKIRGVLIDRQAANSEPAAGEDLLTALGAPHAVLHIGGDTIRMAPNEDSAAIAPSGDVGTTTAALGTAPPSSVSRCASNNFCTSNKSYNSNYWVYRSIGSSTSQTKGGITTTYQDYSPHSDPYTALDDMGQPYTAYGPPYCLPGDIGYESGDQLAGCAKVVIKGTNSMAITNIYYTTSGSPNPFAIGTESKSASNVTSLDLGKSAIGVFLFGCNLDFGPAECDIKGVCGIHFSTGNGGSTMATTSAGSVDPSSCY